MTLRKTGWAATVVGACMWARVIASGCAHVTLADSVADVVASAPAQAPARRCELLWDEAVIVDKSLGPYQGSWPRVQIVATGERRIEILSVTRPQDDSYRNEAINLWQQDSDLRWTREAVTLASGVDVGAMRARSGSRDGGIYVVWSETTGVTTRLMYRGRHEGEWQPSEVVSGTDASIRSGEIPDLEISVGADAVDVFWIDWSREVRFCHEECDRPTVFHRRRTEKGWQKAGSLSGHFPAWCNSPRAVMRPDKRLEVAWFEENRDGRGVYRATSSVGGWERPVKLFSCNTDGRGRGLVELASDNSGTNAIAWGCGGRRVSEVLVERDHRRWAAPLESVSSIRVLEGNPTFAVGQESEASELRTSLQKDLLWYAESAAPVSIARCLPDAYDVVQEGDVIHVAYVTAKGVGAALNYRQGRVKCGTELTAPSPGASSGR